MDTQVELIAKAGVYRCPFKCGDPRYPAPKWKTEAGARKHLAQCPKRPEAMEAQRKADEARQAAFEQTKATALASARHKIGDTIHFVSIHVRKPTHENQRGRMVRVRYEEVRHYGARTEVIASVGFDGGCVVYNHRITEADIFPTVTEAEEQARTRQVGYDERCRLAAECR